jgi:drug/metabolite transporter (DMT)-like permease
MLFLFFGRKTRLTAKPGDLALVFGTLFGAAQVIMESLRDDGHMLWGFVRASQIISILLPVAAITLFSIRLIRKEGMSLKPVAAWLIAGAAIGLAIIKEFDIDTSNNLTREYALMSLAMAVLAAVALLLWRKAKAVQKQNT